MVNFSQILLFISNKHRTTAILDWRVVKKKTAILIIANRIKKVGSYATLTPNVILLEGQDPEGRNEASRQGAAFFSHSLILFARDEH